MKRKLTFVVVLLRLSLETMQKAQIWTDFLSIFTKDVRSYVIELYYLSAEHL